MPHPGPTRPRRCRALTLAALTPPPDHHAAQQCRSRTGSTGSVSSRSAQPRPTY